MRQKILSYMGFAKKSRNMVSGTNSCMFAMEKGRVKLLILTGDLSENTLKKMMKLAKEKNVTYRIYGESKELSQVTGGGERGVFGITDENFARVILKEIDC